MVQREVRATFRTQAEIDAERQGKIVVYPTAAQTDSECFPCLAIEVFRPDHTVQRPWLDLRSLGTNFPTLDAAHQVAKRVVVLSVDDYGKVEWKLLPVEK